MRSATARTCSWAASWSTSRWQASTRATPPAARRRSHSRSAFRGSCATSHAALRCAWGVVGLLNIQFAIKDQVIYVIEANPRASRTVPFVSKSTGVPLARIAARIMAGEKLARSAPSRRRPRVRLLLREGSRHAVRPLPWLRRRARPRDEVDWRGHGHRRQFPCSVHQDPARDRLRAAAGRGSVHLGERWRQAQHHGDRSLHCAPRVLARCNDGHCPRPSRVGHRMRRGWQDPRRLAHDSRPHRIGRDSCS